MRISRSIFVLYVNKDNFFSLLIVSTLSSPPPFLTRARSWRPIQTKTFHMGRGDQSGILFSCTVLVLKIPWHWVSPYQGSAHVVNIVISATACSFPFYLLTYICLPCCEQITLVSFIILDESLTNSPLLRKVSYFLLILTEYDILESTISMLNAVFLSHVWELDNSLEVTLQIYKR